jgi:hypothetical protein
MNRLALTIVMNWLAGCSTVATVFHPGNPLGPGEFSHRAFEDVLQVTVRDGQVDYPAIQTDRRFAQYLDQLDRVDPNGFSREDRLAYWINAYNAFAVKGILDGYSPMTLWGRYRYFIGRDYRVSGAHINLYDLERAVLIGQFHEPLMHFAIVCASASCPKLQPWAYEGTRLPRQLDQVARAFINDPTRNRFDRRQKVAWLSMIFKWFEQDFTAAAGSTLAYVARYIDNPDLAKELIQPGYRIEFLEYDWSLNGIPPQEVARVGPS